MRVHIHHGRVHEWEVRSASSGECLFASDFFGKVIRFIDDNGHQCVQGTTEQSVLPIYMAPARETTILDSD